MRRPSGRVQELLAGHVSAHFDAVGRRQALEPGAGQHQPELGPLAPEQAKGFEQPLVVLVRPAVSGVQQERLARPFTGAQPLEVEAEVDHAHALGWNAEPLDDRLLDVLTDRDHEPALTDGGAVGDAAIRTLGAREELREKLVLDVQDRSRRGYAGPARDRERQREVERVEPGRIELAPDRAGMDARQRHRIQPSRCRAGGTVRRDGASRHAVDCIRGDRGREHAVLEPADPRQRAHQLARVGLGAAGEPRNQRQQADPDHRARDPTVQSQGARVRRHRRRPSGSAATSTRETGRSSSPRPCPRGRG